MGKKGKRKKKATRSRGVAPTAPAASAASAAPAPSWHTQLEALRVMYTALGKDEWWWIMDPSIELAATTLREQHYVYLDHFLTPSTAAALREVVKVHALEGSACGPPQPGHLAGGKTGTSLKYVLPAARGDTVTWCSGQETAMGLLEKEMLLKVSTLVSEMKPHVPDLEGIGSRSKVMCTVYPGEGAGYRYHCDNPNANGRRLTGILYLNPGWKKGDGGELRVFHGPPREKEEREIVAPLMARLLLFWSDKRVPHEVLASHRMRYACTVWFFDDEEKRVADRDAAAASTEMEEEERVRIAAEIDKFEGVYGQTAQVGGVEAAEVELGASRGAAAGASAPVLAAAAAAAAAVEVVVAAAEANEDEDSDDRLYDAQEEEADVATPERVPPAAATPTPPATLPVEVLRASTAAEVHEDSDDELIAAPARTAGVPLPAPGFTDFDELD